MENLDTGKLVLSPIYLASFFSFFIFAMSIDCQILLDLLHFSSNHPKKFLLAVPKVLKYDHNCVCKMAELV